jgi:hypothetical protein
MTDSRKLLQRQAAWQKRRKVLSWAEKIRMAERVREDAAKLRSTGSKNTKRKSRNRSS